MISYSATFQMLEPRQNPISAHDVPMSVYFDIEPDIGYRHGDSDDIADTRYRDMSRYRDTRRWYRDIPDTSLSIGYTRAWYRVYPISGIPDIGTNIGKYRYRGQVSRYRVTGIIMIEFPDITHDVSCSHRDWQQAPGPGLGLAFRLLQPARNR